MREIATFGALALGVALGRLVLALVANDVKGWLPYLSRRFITRAAARLPTDHAERWAEEWESDLKQFEDRPLTGLLHAAQLPRSAARMAHELGSLKLVVEQAVENGETWMGTPAQLAAYYREHGYSPETARRVAEEQFEMGRRRTEESNERWATQIRDYWQCREDAGDKPRLW